MLLPRTPLRFVFHFIFQQRIKFFLFITIFMVWGINDTLFPFFLKHIVNTLQYYVNTREQVYHALTNILLLIVVFWLITESLMRIQGVMQIYFFPRLRAAIRQAVFKYVTSHSHEYFSSHFAGNLAKKLGDLPTSTQSITEIICLQFVAAITGAMMVIVMMWLTRPLFSCIVMVWLSLHLGWTFLFLRKSNQWWVKHSDSVSTLGGKITDVFTNMLNVRLFSRSDYEANYLQHFQQDEIKKAKKAMWLTELMHMGLGINGLLLIFSMTFLLLQGWVNHKVTLGDFTQVEMQTFWILGWSWYISFQLKVFARELGTVGDALNLIKKSHDIQDKPQAKPLVIARGEICFEQVSFCYRKNNLVFKDFSVKIPAGQKVGLVGFSGSGKSTFVNLILRFYDIQAGKILIDGQNIAEVTQNSLREQIAMIPQDPSLFHRSLLENIRYGRLGATDEEVITAAKIAHCHEFIEKLDEGYHSLVGERGIKLSGGQRQRIAIARAVLKNSPILMLDEATSSLDSVTEKLIQESLRQLMKSRTTLVVAHRLSTLSDMDRILVFHQGKIIEEGAQHELLKNNGHFAHLWRMQTNGFLPEHER